jgi:glutamate carboxypeptidase
MIRRRRSIETLLAFIIAVTPAWSPPPIRAQGLSDTERQLVAEVDAHADEAISLLERLVNINSGTMNLGGVRAVGRILGDQLTELGFEVGLTDGSAFDRAGHLVAHRAGTGPHLLLIGHLDTVFEPDSPFQTFHREGDRAAGPGVVDMKGGDVVIVHALRALAAVGVLDELEITVVMTGDEERSGSPLDLSKAAIVEAARAADIAIAFENGDSNPATAVVARRGSTSWRVEVTGTPAHSSQLFQPEVGAGAIYEAARILTAFYERLAGEPLLTFNPGLTVAGTTTSFDPATAAGTAFGKNNVVAERATITGDLRTITLEQLEATRAIMRHIVAQSLPGTNAEITFDEGYPPLAPADGNRRLLSMFDQVSRDLGFGPVAPVDPRNAGAADVAFTTGLVEMAIDGLGPGGGNDHTIDEWIDLPTLAVQTKRAAVLMLRLARWNVS